MKREERIQQIVKVAKAKKLNMNTLVFLLVITPDKGLVKIQKEIEEHEDLYRVEARRTPRGKVIAAKSRIKESEVEEFKKSYSSCIIKLVKLKK